MMVAASPCHVGPAGGAVGETSVAGGGAEAPWLGVIGPSSEHAASSTASAPAMARAGTRGARRRPAGDVRALLGDVEVVTDNDIRLQMTTPGSGDSSVAERAAAGLPSPSPATPGPGAPGGSPSPPASAAAAGRSGSPWGARSEEHT